VLAGCLLGGVALDEPRSLGPQDDAALRVENVHRMVADVLYQHAEEAVGTRRRLLSGRC
jgi:hypothetical protein